MLIASQPSGAFAQLHRKFEMYNEKLGPLLTYHPPQVPYVGDLETRTWLIGNLRSNAECIVDSSATQPMPSASIPSKSRYYMALCMADGTVCLIDPTIQGNNTTRIIWSSQLPVRGELFGLCKVKLTKDKGDQFCVCSWDGTTFVFNLQKESFRFALGRSCQAFIAGHFAIEPGKNEPVFVYSTFDRSLLIYFNLNVDHVAEPSLFAHIQSNTQVINKLMILGVNSSERSQLKSVVHYLLYELPRRQPEST